VFVSVEKTMRERMVFSKRVNRMFASAIIASVLVVLQMGACMSLGAWRFSPRL
jgi:hypothetical protein